MQKDCFTGIPYFILTAACSDFKKKTFETDKLKRADESKQECSGEASVQEKEDI